MFPHLVQVDLPHQEVVEQELYDRVEVTGPLLVASDLVWRVGRLVSRTAPTAALYLQNKLNSTKYV